MAEPGTPTPEPTNPNPPPPSPPPAPAPAPDDDAAYWRSQAKAAFEERQKAKQALRELEARALSDEDRELFEKLKGEQAKLEEQRKRKEGEFDAWRQQIAQEHQGQMKALQDKIAEAEKAKDAETQRLHDVLVSHAFFGSPDLFGAPDALTILDPEVGKAFYGRFVAVDTAEDGTHRIVVKDPATGQTLFADDGRPMSFADGMRKVIRALPNASRVLRGSGKAGSGSPGGASHAAGPADLDELMKRAQRRDPEAIKLLRERQASKGGIVFGTGPSRAS